MTEICSKKQIAIIVRIEFCDEAVTVAETFYYCWRWSLSTNIIRNHFSVVTIWIFSCCLLFMVSAYNPRMLCSIETNELLSSEVSVFIIFFLRKVPY